MATDFFTIAAALKTTLDAIFAGTGYQVYDAVPGTFDSKAIIVQPDSGDFGMTAGASGMDEHQLEIMVLHHLGDREWAQEQLKEFMTGGGAASLRGAIIADHTLGGVVRHAMVTGYRDYGTRRYNEMDFLSLTFPVVVQAF